MKKINPRDVFEILRKEKTAVFLDSGSKIGARSLLFIKPKKILKASSVSQVKTVLKQAEAQAAKNWVCGYVSYEAGAALEPALKMTAARRPPLYCWFGVFDKPFLSGEIDKNSREFMEGVVRARAKMPRKDYLRGVKRIKRLIACGETYQVNLAFDWEAESALSGPELYFSLRKNQPADYCSYVKHDDISILSYSPELFFRKNGSKITLKPMKGTGFSAGRALNKDPKNVAENIMIVDLIRNDLGRICRKGSVKTRKMLKIEKHPTLYQMTSEVRGVLNPGRGFTDIVQNIFPSGSVTGAPKISTMRIINSLEKTPRFVYCGMLGFISPGGEMVFSVPIRTLFKTRLSGGWTYKSGSGITWASDPEDEYRECEGKAAFLTRSPEFCIFESILWDNELVFLNEHLKRLKKSAAFFRFRLDKRKLEETIADIKIKLKNSEKRKVRLILNRQGGAKWESRPLENKLSRKIEISKDAVYSKNRFLGHKTTYKPWYENALKRVKEGKVFDVIFVNEKNEITEGSRSNIFLEKKAVLYTPPLECGLLPGVLRENLIKSGKCKVKKLYKEDLIDADSIYCGNSVRGLVKVSLI